MLVDATMVAVIGLILLVLTTTAWFRLAMRVAIPDNRLPFLFFWGLAAILGAASFFSTGSGWLSGIVGTVAMLGGGGLLVLYLLRKQGAGDTISVGDRIPEFSASDETGTVIESSQFVGSPTLIKFFRGHW